MLVGLQFTSCLCSLDFSIAKKYFQGLVNWYYFGVENYGLESLESTQKAKEWGQSCKTHNHFRPQALPEKFSTGYSGCTEGTRL